jgi:hypothetical protein
MMPATLPDLTNYGLLGGFLLLVLIFLGFGLAILRYAFAALRGITEHWASEIRSLTEDNGRRNTSREELLGRRLEASYGVISKVTKALGKNTEAFRDAAAAFRRRD